MAVAEADAVARAVLSVCHPWFCTGGRTALPKSRAAHKPHSPGSRHMQCWMSLPSGDRSRLVLQAGAATLDRAGSHGLPKILQAGVSCWQSVVFRVYSGHVEDPCAGSSRDALVDGTISMYRILNHLDMYNFFRPLVIARSLRLRRVENFWEQLFNGEADGHICCLECPVLIFKISSCRVMLSIGSSNVMRRIGGGGTCAQHIGSSMLPEVEFTTTIRSQDVFPAVLSKSFFWDWDLAFQVLLQLSKQARPAFIVTGCGVMGRQKMPEVALIKSPQQPAATAYTCTHARAHTHTHTHTHTHASTHAGTQEPRIIQT